MIFRKINDTEKISYRKLLTINGFCKIPQYISKIYLKELTKEITELFWKSYGNNDFNFINDFENDCVTLSSAHNLLKYSKLYKELVNQTNLHNDFFALTNHVPNVAEISNSSFFYKPRVSKDIKPHQDNAYFCFDKPLNCLTYYVCVNNQNIKNGTIYYWENSQTLGDLKHIPEGNLGASMCLSREALKLLRNYKRNYISLESGDVVIHNSLVCHGTLQTRLKSRSEAFNFTLFPVNSSINKQKKERYFKLLAQFLEQSKSVGQKV